MNRRPSYLPLEPILRESLAAAEERLKRLEQEIEANPASPRLLAEFEDVRTKISRYEKALITQAAVDRSAVQGAEEVWIEVSRLGRTYRSAPFRRLSLDFIVRELLTGPPNRLSFTVRFMLFSGARYWKLWSGNRHQQADLRHQVEREIFALGGPG